MVITASPWDPRYEREEDWIVHCYSLATGNVLRYCARDVKRERTGIHALVSISINWVTLAWTTFNIERDEDRVRLANSAYKHLDSESHSLDRAEFPANVFKHALDLFCLGLWDEVVGETLGGMMEGCLETPPARPLIGNYVLMDAGTILFAPPGFGKSNTAMAWCVSCAWGKEEIWNIGDSWLPLYINVERSQASMAARLARVNRALGLDPRTPIPFLNARGKTLADIYEAAKKTMKAEGCRWAVYDSISRAGFGSLKDDDVANRSMDMLNALTPTWVALAHSPRQDDSHAFGSQMFDAAADVTVQLKAQTSRDGLSTGIGLEIIKANDIRKGPMQVHVFEWAEDGLAKIRRGKVGEFAELAASERKGKEDMAREYLLQMGEQTATQLADHFGWARNHTSSMLNAAGWAVRMRRGAEVYFGVSSELVGGN